MVSRVLITGGAGFIGSHMADLLLENGVFVVIFDNFSTGEYSNIQKHQLCRVVEGDIRNEADLNRLFSDYPDMDTVIHLAAQSKVGQSLTDPQEDGNVNIIGTINVLEAASRHGIKHFAYASSAAVYGDVMDLPVTEETPCRPLSPYGISKLAAEYYVLSYGVRLGIHTGVFRFSNVFGPRQKAGTESGVITIFIDSLLNGQPPTVNGDGEQTRDFVFVRDVAHAIYDFLNENRHNESVQNSQDIYHVSTNFETSINSLLMQLQSLVNSELSPVYSKERPGDIRYSRLANDKIKQSLGWSVKTDLISGLEQTVNYERSR